jgi:hypothetical protein
MAAVSAMNSPRYWRILRWQEFEQDTAELRATPELYAGYLAESAQWLNADLGDGLADSASAEYPEYQGGQS